MNTNLTITAFGYGQLPLTSDIPFHLSAHHIPGSKPIVATAPFGNIVLQMAQMKDICFVISLFEIFQEVTLLLQYPSPVIISRFAVLGGFSYFVKEVGNIDVPENHFCIFHCNDLSNKLTLKDGMYISVDINYSENEMLHTLRFYPMHEDFGQAIRNKKPSVLSKNGIASNAVINNGLYTLLHSPFSVFAQEFHKRILSTLLEEQLKLVPVQVENALYFSLSEIERIRSAKELIDKSIPDHLTIRQIASIVRINQQKLKVGFKQIFGKGLYSYLREQVLTIARIELEETKKSVKEIAYRSGYKSANNFSAAFKKHFGITPLNLRKRSRGKHDENIGG